MHVRGQIRAAVRDLLTQIAGLGDNVAIDEPDAVDESQLPFAFIWLGNEDVVATRTLGGSGNVPKQDRDADLMIDVLCRQLVGAADEAESLAATIEYTLAAHATLGGLCAPLQLRGYTIDRPTETGQPVLRLRLQYLVSYTTETGRATVAL